MADRLCASKDPLCTGMLPCTQCEEAFFFGIVEPALIAAAVDQEQAVRFIDAYWGRLYHVKGEIAAAEQAKAQPQAPASTASSGQVHIPPPPQSSAATPGPVPPPVKPPNGVAPGAVHKKPAQDAPVIDVTKP